MALYGWRGSVFRHVQQRAPFLQLFTQEPLLIQATNSLGRFSSSSTSTYPVSPSPSAFSDVLSACTETADSGLPCPISAKRDTSNGRLESKDCSSTMLETLSQVCWGLTGKCVTNLGRFPQSGSFQCAVDSEEAFSRRFYTTASFDPASQRARQHSAATTSSRDAADSVSRAEAELAASAPSKTKSDGTIGIRWYKHVGVEQIGDSSFHVTLDGKRLPSPARRPLVLPTKELALAIAAEWEWQDQKSIRPFTMPLMKLASTATDLVPLQRNAIVENLMKYFRTSDAVCVREPRWSQLQKKQGEIWDPLLDWMEQELGVRPVTSGSIFGAEQPPEIVRPVQVGMFDTGQHVLVEQSTRVCRAEGRLRHVFRFSASLFSWYIGLGITTRFQHSRGGGTDWGP